MQSIILQTGVGPRKIVGGKAFSLLTLYNARFNVPPFLVITTKAIKQFKNRTARKGLISEIKKWYKTVIKTGKVAVRSSATVEDSRESSFAGQFKTVLNVDIDDIYTAIKAIYKSISNVMAIYASKTGKTGKIEMAIIIQKMVDADRAGVIFTADPIKGDRDKVIVEVIRGLGEALVSGARTPTTYYFSKTNNKILSRTGENLITARKLKQLCSTAISIERLFGYPQDIEFAIKRGKVYILQSRDITTL
ncbi:MAG: PEP/pyruvate-binding domain-containing protein [Candidatus Micrarchaeia archaeon]